MNKHALIDFFYFGGRDGQGRTLDFILNQHDDWFESTHDFIQWLFPLREKSGANPNAPLIDNELLGAFRLYKAGPDQMVRALDRVLRFYGLQRDDHAITKKGNWDQRKGYWFVEPTHNNLRISRILKSMSILELGEYSQAFLDVLLNLAGEADCGFSSEAIGFWKSAIEPSGFSKAIADKSSPLVVMADEKMMSDLIYERDLSRLRRFEARRQVEDAVNIYFSKRYQ